MANYKIQRTCIVCGTEFMSWHTYQTRTCSPSCTKKFRFNQLVDSYSERAKMPIDQWLRQKYVDELWSYRDLIQALGIRQVKVVQKLLKHFDIPIRKGSEAVATQFKRNPQRRDLSRQLFLDNDLPPKKGGPNSTDNPETRKKISLAKKGHPMYQSDSWYQNVCRSIQKRQQQIPSTDIEQLMQHSLIELNLPFEKQKPIDLYTVDFAIEHNGRKVAIECDGLYWHSIPGRAERDEKRDKTLSDLGWTVLRFTDKDINKDIAYCLRVVLSALDC